MGFRFLLPLLKLGVHHGAPGLPQSSKRGSNQQTKHKRREWSPHPWGYLCLCRGIPTQMASRPDTGYQVVGFDLRGWGRGAVGGPLGSRVGWLGKVRPLDAKTSGRRPRRRGEPKRSGSEPTRPSFHPEDSGSGDFGDCGVQGLEGLPF